MVKPLQKGFRSHFIEATEINRIRKRYYSEKTNGKSKGVSNALIYWEKVLYPIAWYFDFRARRHNSKGIGIVADDFVSLQHINPIDTKPSYGNILTFRDIRDLFVMMRTLRGQVRTYLKTYDFFVVNRIVGEYIQLVANKETEKMVHITMLKHILESVAFAAKNAIEYSKSGDKGVKQLASCFIRTQLLGTILSPFIDRAANRIHRMGHGIVVNDVPQIPYRIE